MSTSGRFLLNVLITLALLVVFHWFGWITFENLDLWTIIQVFLVMAGIGLLIAAASYLAAKLAIASGSTANSLMVLAALVVLIPCFFWIVLTTAATLTGLFTVNVGFVWQGIVMTLMRVLTVVREPRKNERFRLDGRTYTM